MLIDTRAHASEDEHVGAGMTSMLHAELYLVSVWACYVVRKRIMHRWTKTNQHA